MGAWGEDIMENDTSADVYYAFMELYDENIELPDIHDEMVESMIAISDDINDCVDGWLALAQAEWECGYHNEETYTEVRNIIESKDKLDDWHQSRHEIIVNFYNSISKPVAVPRERQERIPEKAIYPVGACLAINLYVGGYGAAIVLQNEVHGRNDLYIDSLIGGLRGIHQDLPTMDVFEKRDWLYLTHHNFKGALHLSWVGQPDILENQDKIVVVGQTKIREEDPTAIYPKPPTEISEMTVDNLREIYSKISEMTIDKLGEISSKSVGFGGIGWVENQIWKQDEWDRNQK